MLQPDPSWTLFLDRDGVLNRRLPGAYVRSREEFEWLPGVLKAMAQLSNLFGRIVVVTNQQGIGKGLMNEVDLAEVHRMMKAEIQATGGRIDGIYYCPDLAGKPDNCRKPAPAMALQAKRDFPEIDFRKSIIVGDSISDMQFGQALGMYKVLITTKEEEAAALKEQRDIQIEEQHESLWNWVADFVVY